MQDKEQPSKPKHSLMRQILHGAICCNAGMFFVAPVVATLYQFPAFPNGKVGGLEGLFTNGWAETLLAVWFTLVVFIIAGGFVVLGLLGGVAGCMSYKVFGASVGNLYWRAVTENESALK